MYQAVKGSPERQNNASGYDFLIEKFSSQAWFPANPVRRKGFEISCPSKTEQNFRDLGDGRGGEE